MYQIGGFQQVEEELRLVVEMTPNLIWVAAPDGSITFCNRSLADYTGLTCEQIMKENWLHFLHPDEQHPVAVAWKEAVQTDSLYEEEYRLGNFERFNRGTYPRKERAFPGLGMGLYIAQEIVKHYQGEILVESEEGKGSIFTLSLPMAS